jgi:putative addiction module component (TIGR02574 family)
MVAGDSKGEAMSIEQLTAEILALPIKDRTRLVEVIQDSIDQSVSPGPSNPYAADAELIQMLRERCEELDSGVDPGVPYEEVIAEIRKSLT